MRTLRAAGWVGAGMVVAASVALSGWSALNGDVTYALGGIETAGRGGVSVWDVFVARPVAYRLVVGGLDDVRALLAGDGSFPATHLVIRIETGLVVVAVAAVLLLGLRRFLGVRAAVAVAGATGLALVVAPPWHFLEPDWVATLAAVLAVGAACAPRRVWLGAVLGGLAACLVIAVKLATVPIAVLALLLVAVLDRRRAAWSAAATIAFTLLWYASTKLFLPWEWTWLADQANLVHNSPIHHAPRLHDLKRLLVSLGDVAILGPIVVAAPAAAAALVRRWRDAGVALVAAGLSVASAYGQGEFFMYHYAVVPVLAAGVCAAAFALRRHARIPLVATTLVASAASAVVLRQPAHWRLAHANDVATFYAVGALIALLVVLVRPVRVPVPWTVAVVALCAALVPAVLPNAPYAFRTYDYNVHVRRPADDGYAALSARLGRDTPVLYLTFGALNYPIGNPTSCRYPSPQWLQRGSFVPRVRAYRSYADNLRCLTEDRDARYLVWQPLWFDLPGASPRVRSLIEERFDCSPAARIPSPPAVVVCPAR